MAALLISSSHLLKSAEHPSPPSFQMEMLMTLRKCRPFSTAKCIHLFSHIIYYKRHDCCKDWGIWGWILFHWYFSFTDGRRDFWYSQSGDELRVNGSRSTVLSLPHSTLLLKRSPKDEAGTWLSSNPDQLLGTRIDIRYFLCFQHVSVCSCKSLHPHGFWVKGKMIYKIIEFLQVQNEMSGHPEINHNPKDSKVNRNIASKRVEKLFKV